MKQQQAEGTAFDHSTEPAIPSLKDMEVYDFPLSYAQERVWFLQQLYPESTAYHISGALELQGQLDHQALQHALLHLV
ncbi:MAG: condensation domain-containing protein, partial [Pseudomonadales bacterium]|nr:condensation domain-containing protein [Pseudomonadales bacterium]